MFAEKNADSEATEIIAKFLKITKENFSSENEISQNTEFPLHNV
jgi:hemerythrin